MRMQAAYAVKPRDSCHSQGYDKTDFLYVKEEACVYSVLVQEAANSQLYTELHFIWS
jgi:hypothetical protein